MRYIDTGSRDGALTLGAWLRDLRAPQIQAIRLQTGYFNAGGVAPFVSHLEYVAARDLPTRIVLGSNEGETSDEDVGVLLDLIGAPRVGAELAVLHYEGGLFHPKVYHVTRDDGTQTAYVGSANLTASGVNGSNIEAGIILDSGDGDPGQPLDDIARAIDAWFDGTRPSSILTDRGDLGALVAAQALGVERPRTPNRVSVARGRNVAPGRLSALIHFDPLPTPRVSTRRRVSTDTMLNDGPPRLYDVSGNSFATPRDGFPSYILFAPGVNDPTSGENALSGSVLPGHAAGLIVRLNHDSARHFRGGSGTANISVPVATLSTMRFGMYRRRHVRPRVEFKLRTRLIHAGGVHLLSESNTNIMVYGHTDDESGHGDVRMLVPKGATQPIREYVDGNDLRGPVPDDPMLLEWPTPRDPTFKATFFARDAPIFDDLRDRLNAARDERRLVGRGACWLPAGLSPPWLS